MAKRGLAAVDQGPSSDLPETGRLKSPRAGIGRYEAAGQAVQGVAAGRDLVEGAREIAGQSVTAETDISGAALGRLARVAGGDQPDHLTLAEVCEIPDMLHQISAHLDLPELMKLACASKSLRTAVYASDWTSIATRWLPITHPSLSGKNRENVQLLMQRRMVARQHVEAGRGQTISVTLSSDGVRWLHFSSCGTYLVIVFFNSLAVFRIEDDQDLTEELWRHSASDINHTLSEMARYPESLFLPYFSRFNSVNCCWYVGSDVITRCSQGGADDGIDVHYAKFNLQSGVLERCGFVTYTPPTSTFFGLEYSDGISYCPNSFDRTGTLLGFSLGGPDSFKAEVHYLQPAMLLTPKQKSAIDQDEPGAEVSGAYDSEQDDSNEESSANKVSDLVTVKLLEVACYRIMLLSKYEQTVTG
ncbi:hypothetical protein WJX73_008849 [Symbiochloris irregularis]|uniref:F-box domain-containing protein n=1 Tax=Symbiochloris irregularis TaxID=706552 RepID=A0AAW1NUD5_9CHLO